MTEVNKSIEQRSKRKRVHAMGRSFKNLCGSRGNRTSLVDGAQDKSFWAIVTCKACRRLRYTEAKNYG